MNSREKSIMCSTNLSIDLSHINRYTFLCTMETFAHVLWNSFSVVKLFF